MPVQKARALRNSPPHAGAKGPCPAKLPCPAACRRKRPMPRGTPRRRMPAERHPAKRQTIPSLAQPSPDKNNDLSGQKGTAADFFTSPPETGAAPLSENPSEGSRRSPVAGAESARRPNRSTAPEELSKKGHPADRRHRQKTTLFSSPEGINNRIINQICPQKKPYKSSENFQSVCVWFPFYVPLPTWCVIHEK